MRALSVILCFLFTISPGAEAWLFRNRRQRCFGNLGCFSVENAQGFDPQGPQTVNVHFELCTSSRRIRFHRTTAQSVLNLNADPTLKTALVIHGYTESMQSSWVDDMARELLRKEPMNIIKVDWSGGGQHFIYLQAVANAHVAAAVVAGVLENLVQMGADPTTFHLIGHSLGAHLAGLVGARVPNIGRITGLDPAGPAFLNVRHEDCLDPTDANFVDIIHTDARIMFNLNGMGLGISTNCGTVDFWVNGGFNQPGCGVTALDSLRLLLFGNRNAVMCSHMRAPSLFTASINSCPVFPARKCLHPTRHTNIHCPPCSRGSCETFGYNISPNANGSYYVETTGVQPYCRY